MDFLADVASWFADPAHYDGPGGVQARIREHVTMSVFAVACAAVVAIPPALWLGHRRRGGLVAVSVVNIGRAIPSFAIVAIALPVSIRLGLGLGFWPTWLAVVLLAMPPLFTNTYTAIAGVAPQVVDAARGMGLRESQILLGVELPLAVPLIFAGLRVASVQVVATVPLGALVGWGGLGRFIIDGLAVRDFPQVFAGAALVALLAIATELSYGAIERVVLPAGVRHARTGRIAGRPI